MPPNCCHLTPKVNKDSALTRIHFMNVNGLTKYTIDKIKEITAFIQEHQVDFFGLAETNRHWNNMLTYNNYLKTIKNNFNDAHYYLYTSDINIPWRSEYKQGGTKMITRQNITTRISQKENDFPLDRWSTITIGIMHHNISIITSYIVCNTTINAEKTQTAAYQQWDFISNTNSKCNHNPRKHAIADLCKHVQKNSK